MASAVRFFSAIFNNIANIANVAAVNHTQKKHRHFCRCLKCKVVCYSFKSYVLANSRYIRCTEDVGTILDYDPLAFGLIQTRGLLDALRCNMHNSNRGIT